MNQTIRIDHRFCGPPNSGNGGYVCAVMDNQTDYISQVTLRKPPPLDTDMHVLSEQGIYSLYDGEELVALAEPGKIDFQAPAPPAFELAAMSAKKFVAAEDRHFFPSCFVCGPDRENHDGLEIFAGVVEGRNIVASTWVPDDSLSGTSREVKNEFMWAALDCPGAFAIMKDQIRKLILGRLTAEIRKLVSVGEECVVIGWEKGSEGRKHFSGTAVYNSKQELCAVGDAIWIEID